MLQGVWKQHLRPCTVVGYGVKIPVLQITSPDHLVRKESQVWPVTLTTILPWGIQPHKIQPPLANTTTCQAWHQLSYQGKWHNNECLYANHYKEIKKQANSSDDKWPSEPDDPSFTLDGSKPCFSFPMAHEIAAALKLTVWDSKLRAHCPLPLIQCKDNYCLLYTSPSPRDA